MRVQAGEPGLGRAGVSHEVDVHVEGAQVALRVREVVGGGVVDDDAGPRGWSWGCGQCNAGAYLGKTQDKVGDDGAGEHLEENSEEVFGLCWKILKMIAWSGLFW